ncbi:MAG: hypothetical protein ACOVK7_13870 [Burkholderiaceae bacterium]|jgi:hypothetical protein|nr:hypothetical protein [Burkholderiales bacterium]
MADPLPDSALTRTNTLRGQTPVALLSVFAIVALVLVNWAPPPQRATPAQAHRCADCGEVIAVRSIAASKSGTAPVQDGVVVDVRMPDGRVLTLPSEQLDVRIGMRVPVRGHAVSPRP